MQVTLVARVLGTDDPPSVTYENVERVTGVRGFTPEVHIHRTHARDVYRACSGFEKIRIRRDGETEVIKPNRIGADPPSELPIVDESETVNGGGEIAKSD